MKRLGFSRYINSTLIGKREGKIIRLPIIGGIGLENVTTREPWMLDILKVFSRKEGLFMDVGANLGQTLLHFISHQPCTHYVGFEPNHVCFQYLQALVKANNLENVMLISKALTNTSGKKKLRYYGKQSTDASATLLDNFRPGQLVISEQVVDSISWEDLDFPLKNEKLVWLKIDVEGSEWEVIQSLSQKIQEDIPHILIEILPVYRPENKERLERQQLIEKTIASWGYLMFRVNMKPSGEITFENLKTIGIHGDMDATNYLLLHSTHLDEIQSLL